MPKFFGLSLASALASWQASAMAEVLQVQCSADTGVSYYADQGVIAGKGGWTEDQTSEGETVIRINLDTEEVVLRFKDASGTWSDASDVGGSSKVWRTQDAPASIGVFVVYEGAELGSTLGAYTIAEIDFTNSKATLIYSQARITPNLTSSRLTVSDCALSRF